MHNKKLLLITFERPSFLYRSQMFLRNSLSIESLLPVCKLNFLRKIERFFRKYLSISFSIFFRMQEAMKLINTTERLLISLHQLSWGIHVTSAKFYMPKDFPGILWFPLYPSAEFPYAFMKFLKFTKLSQV